MCDEYCLACVFAVDEAKLEQVEDQGACAIINSQKTETCC